MERLLQVEKQLRDLRVTLKWSACIISPLLTLKLFWSVTDIFITTRVFGDLSNAAVPSLFKFFTAYPLLTKSLPFLSLLTFIALLVICFRNRGLLFFYLFAASLAIHLILFTVMDLANRLLYYKVMVQMGNS